MNKLKLGDEVKYDEFDDEVWTIIHHHKDNLVIIASNTSNYGWEVTFGNTELPEEYLGYNAWCVQVEDLVLANPIWLRNKAK